MVRFLVKLQEQQRKVNLITKLANYWCASNDGVTTEELTGFYSLRQIEFLIKNFPRWEQHGPIPLIE